MKATLRRLTSNKTTTHGRLSVEGYSESVITAEGRVPEDGQSYTGWCLPPGTYKLRTAKRGITVDGIHIVTDWLEFDQVPWFPSAGFVWDLDNYPTRGMITFGEAARDQYDLLRQEEAKKIMIRIARFVKEHSEDGTVDLEIIENRDEMTIGRYRKGEFEEIMKEKAEREKKENLINEIFADYEKRIYQNSN